MSKTHCLLIKLWRITAATPFRWPAMSADLIAGIRRDRLAAFAAREA
jgi:hypothetical protein